MAVDEDKIKTIIRVLRKKIGLILAGFDVVVENSTGNHAVIDINVFPSYDNFPNFFEHLLDCIQETVNKSLDNDNLTDCGRIDEVITYRYNGLINIGGTYNYGVIGMNIN